MEHELEEEIVEDFCADGERDVEKFREKLELLVEETRYDEREWFIAFLEGEHPRADAAELAKQLRDCWGIADVD